MTKRFQIRIGREWVELRILLKNSTSISWMVFIGFVLIATLLVFSESNAYKSVLLKIELQLKHE